MKTARFKQIVAACGKPRIHLTWVKPEKDRELMRLLKAGRVMTVHQFSRGAGKDFGTVGLFKGERNAQLLVFPKSLRRFAERRVIGIDYSLLAVAKTTATRKAPGKKSLPKARVKPRGERIPAVPSVTPPRTKPAAARPFAPAPPALVAREIKQALRELKAGRIAAARARLEKLASHV